MLVNCRRAVALFAAVMLLGLADASMSTAQVKNKAKGKDDKPAAGLVFETYKDKSGAYRYRLKSGDATLAIAPKGFKTKDELMKVIDAIKKEAGSAKVTEAE